MNPNTKNNAIVGQAIGDALGSFLQDNPNLVKRLHQAFENDNIDLKLVYTAPTQLTLLFLQTFLQLEKPHHITAFQEQLQKNQVGYLVLLFAIFFLD